VAIKIKLKNSVVANKAPLPTDLDIGEVAINANAASPAAYIKDSAGAVVKLAGVGSVSTPDATTAAKGVVQLADAAAVTAGTTGRVVDAAQLKAVSDAATASDEWTRTGTEITPKTAGDSVFTTGDIKVGGTTAAPNIQLNANGTGAFKALSVVTAGGTATDLTLNQTGIQAWSVGLDASDTGLSFRTLGGGAGRKAVLTQGGDFLLGGTLPSAPNITLKADGTVEVYNSYRFSQAIADGSDTYIGYDPSTHGLFAINSVVGSLSGVFLARGTTAWAPITSESRLKDIQSDADVDQCWTLIRDIELKRYYYKDQVDKSGVSYMGPMADWLGAQDPELLIDTGRTDEHGPIHTFNQGLLEMKSLQALSTALKRIEALEAEVAALKAASTHTP
jgi:hypothetical protein